VISYNGNDAARPRSRRAKWRQLGFRLAVGVIVFGVIGAYCTGRFTPLQQRLLDRVYRDTARMGLRVTDLALEGRTFTSREDIAQALAVHEGDPTLAFDPAKARAALESLPRIASAEVDRRLPGTITVRIVERAPIAIWQRQGKMMLIDKDGVILGDQNLADYGALPRVVGEGAAKPASEVLDSLATEPELAKRVTACIRIGERRWDLKLDNNIDVKLPETGEDAAIHKLAELEAKNGLLEHDVVAIDLRLPGKLIVETSQLRDPKAKPAKQQGI
jgi:cell division protein FtsQ